MKRLHWKHSDIINNVIKYFWHFLKNIDKRQKSIIYCSVLNYKYKFSLKKVRQVLQ